MGWNFFWKSISGGFEINDRARGGAEVEDVGFREQRALCKLKSFFLTK